MKAERLSGLGELENGASQITAVFACAGMMDSLMIESPVKSSGQFSPPLPVTARAPRVTIGMPVRNGQKYIAAAIESIIAQTFTDWELVICDNASTDSTEQIVREYAARDPR